MRALSALPMVLEKEATHRWRKACAYKRLSPSRLRS
jgi:hypothetical protein